MDTDVARQAQERGLAAAVLVDMLATAERARLARNAARDAVIAEALKAAR